MSTSDLLREAYERLEQQYGPQGWWPGETPFEVAVGAILTQNTAWTNVEKAIRALKEVDSLNSAAIHAMHMDELASIIRSAGYYRLKAARLKNFVRVIEEQFDGDFDSLLQLPTHNLRERLLEINGIGPETADSIVLYAAGKPLFVVDTYTARVAKRHGWVDYEADYHALQETFQGSLEDDPKLFNQYHALLVRVAKNHCKTQPHCDGCPLQPMLPSGGPLEPL